MKPFPFSLAVLALALTACVAPQARALPASTSPVTQVQDVAFYPQGDGVSGAASLAIMLKHSERDLSPDFLAEKLREPSRQGDPAIALAGLAREQGRLVYPVAPELAALLAALEQGYPVLVRQRSALPGSARHFAVVTGVDRQAGKLWLHAGQTPRLELSLAAFERSWRRADYWGVLVLDPARMPETLDAPVVIRELALMEQLGAVTDAQAGFLRAVLNWPEQKMAWLGLGAIALRQGDVPLAESTLRELVRRQPVYGPGLNNLADLLLKTGRAQEALTYAERAVAVLDVPQTRATLGAVHAALRQQASAGE